MSMKKFLGKLTWPLRKLDKEIEEEIADKTAVTIHAGLQALDKDLPILTSLLAGEKITLEIQLKENAE